MIGMDKYKTDNLYATIVRKLFITFGRNPRFKYFRIIKPTKKMNTIEMDNETNETAKNIGI